MRGEAGRGRADTCVLWRKVGGCPPRRWATSARDRDGSAISCLLSPTDPKILTAPKEKPKPKPKPEKKAQKSAPAEKKKSFDPNRLAALLNKMPEDNAPKQPQQQSEAQVDAPRTDDPDLPLTMSELDAFKVQMAKCWTVPAGAAGAEKLVVKIKVYLSPDGSLAQPPELMDRTKLITGGTTYRAAADAALRAIRLCQPFKMPADKYNSWREIDLTFDPRQMLGG